jgi:hypothetical protein
MSSSAGSSNNNNQAPQIPSELQLNAKWDWAVSEVGTKFVIGTVTAGVAALVLARGPRMRTAITAFGAGFGSGWAYKIVDDKFSVENFMK